MQQEEGVSGEQVGPLLPNQQQHDIGIERVFPCIKLRGLPFDVNDDEIRLFLVR